LNSLKHVIRHMTLAKLIKKALSLEGCGSLSFDRLRNFVYLTIDHILV